MYCTILAMRYLCCRGTCVYWSVIVCWANAHVCELLKGPSCLFCCAPVHSRAGHLTMPLEKVDLDFGYET